MIYIKSGKGTLQEVFHFQLVWKIWNAIVYTKCFIYNRTDFARSRLRHF